MKEQSSFWNGVHFLHADKHQSFCKLALLFLMEVARHVQSTQNRRLVIFLQYVNPLNADFTKWSNTLKQFVGNFPTNCLSVFDHFLRLALEGLRKKCRNCFCVLCDAKHLDILRGSSHVCCYLFLLTQYPFLVPISRHDITLKNFFIL